MGRIIGGSLSKLKPAIPLLSKSKKAVQSANNVFRNSNRLKKLLSTGGMVAGGGLLTDLERRGLINPAQPNKLDYDLKEWGAYSLLNTLGLWSGIKGLQTKSPGKIALGVMGMGATPAARAGATAIREANKITDTAENTNLSRIFTNVDSLAVELGGYTLYDHEGNVIGFKPGRLKEFTDKSDKLVDNINSLKKAAVPAAVILASIAGAVGSNVIFNEEVKADDPEELKKKTKLKNLRNMIIGALAGGGAAYGGYKLLNKDKKDK